MLRKQFSAKDQKSDSKSNKGGSRASRSRSPPREYKLIKVKEVMTLNRSRARLDQSGETSKIVEGPSELDSTIQSKPVIIKSRMANPKRYTTASKEESTVLNKSLALRPSSKVDAETSNIMSRYISAMESQLARYDTQKTPEKRPVTSLMSSPGKRGDRQVDFPELPTQKNLQAHGSQSRTRQRRIPTRQRTEVEERKEEEEQSASVVQLPMVPSRNSLQSITSFNNLRTGGVPQNLT